MYCIQVLTGREKAFQDFIQHICQANPETRIVWPRRKLSILRGGVWHESIKPIFDGYVFVESTLDLQKLTCRLRNVPYFVRFLKSNSDIIQLSKADEDLIRHLLRYGELVEKSEVILGENQMVRVISGPLKDCEGRIVHINKRRKRAKIEIQLYDTTFLVDFGLDVVAAN